MLTLDISLREQNAELFEQLVIDLNDPSHEKYGQHLKGHEVADLLRPSEAARGSVADWMTVRGTLTHCPCVANPTHT